MSGLILGALGGAGEQMANVGQNLFRDSLDADKQQRQSVLDQQTHAVNSNVDLQRQQALEQYKITLANSQREAEVGRINGAAGGIVTGQLAQKYAGSDAAVAAAQGGASPDVSAAEGNDNVQAALTPEQSAVIQQSKDADRTSLMSDPNVRTQAAIQTGDISPKDVMSNTSRQEINQIKMDALLQRAQDHNTTSKEIADVKAEAMKYGYELRLQAAQEKNATGKIDTATGRMLITSEDVNIKAATTQIGTLTRQLSEVRQMKDGKPNPDYTAIQEQIASLNDDIKASKANKVEYLRGMNVMPGASPAPRGGNAASDTSVAPQAGVTGAFNGNPADITGAIANIADPQERANAQAALQQQMRANGGTLPQQPVSVPTAPQAKPISALPAGAVQVGTSGGKPVYQTPDGKRFISQ
jgi:hypothetical protein